MEIRDKARNAFRKNIPNEKTVTNLEIGIFNYSLQEASRKKEVKKWENPKFVQIYSDRLRSLFINMKDEKILNALKCGELLPQTYAFMTHQEMKPEIWKELIEKKSTIDATKFDTNITARTDMFTCGKCKSKKCTYYTMQTRSADEPETIFITCLDCGKNWKR
jgi:transcription elongation factor S-II